MKPKYSKRRRKIIAKKSLYAFLYIRVRELGRTMTLPNYQKGFIVNEEDKERVVDKNGQKLFLDFENGTKIIFNNISK